jgi:hypothetical protein
MLVAEAACYLTLPQVSQLPRYSLIILYDTATDTWCFYGEVGYLKPVADQRILLQWHA